MTGLQRLHLPRLVGFGVACAFGAALAGTVTVTVKDAAGRPLQDAVVQLDSPAAAQAVRAGADQAIVQRDRTFVPSVTVLTKGTAVTFPNEDSVRHHVYSFSPAKRFELKLYTGTPTSPVVFDKPGMAVLGCNIHDQMIAWVHVVETPYHGKTNAQGQVEMPRVPAGRYQLGVWHARLPESQAPFRQAVSVPEAAVQFPVTLNGLNAP